LLQELTHFLFALPICWPSRKPGAINAALFLQEFVENNKPFVHVDMAGVVWATKAGATGWGAKLVTEWVINTAQQESDSQPHTVDQAGLESSTKRRPFFFF
jgi:hypothetical protein